MSRLMDGVRRWMRSQSPAGHLQSRNKAPRKVEQKGAKVRESNVDTKSTEYMANNLLDPEVPEDELDEYQRSVK